MVKEGEEPKKKVAKAIEDNKVAIDNFMNSLEPERKGLVDKALENNALDILNDRYDYSNLIKWLALKDKFDAGFYPVYVGIRPEGFVLNDNGTLKLALDKIEIMGRDISLICKDKASANPFIRAIISSDFKISENIESVSLDIKVKQH